MNSMLNGEIRSGTGLGIGRKSIRGLLLLPVVCLLTQEAGAQGFSPGQVLTGHALQIRAAASADLDGDGAPDLLSASATDGKIAWYRNTDGQGSYGPQRIITEDAFLVQSLVAGDLDGDGDMDVASASSWDDQIVWYENLDSAGTFGPPFTVATEVERPLEMHLADIDADGDLDVLSISAWLDSVPNMVAWYPNTDGLGTFGPERIIARNLDYVTSVDVADLDGDTDLDLLVASNFDDTLSWYENTDWGGVFGPQKTITTDADGPYWVTAADLDGDGDRDVVAGMFRDGVVSWFENTTGDGDFGSRQDIVVGDIAYGRTILAEDLDGDGDRDVLSSYQDQTTTEYVLAWSENVDGLGAFGSPQEITRELQYPAAILVTDDDGDGDPDVIAASPFVFGIARQENTDGAGTFGPREPIVTVVEEPTHVSAADLDGDGDLDALSASYADGKIAWYENLDGQGWFTVEMVIATDVLKASSVCAADMDGDGDQDVVASSFARDLIVWYPNTDGQGTFGSPRQVTDQADGPQRTLAADVDGDGDVDVLSANWHANEIAWYENLDGAGGFGPKRTISDQAIGAKGVHAADVDGDGDLDALSASEWDGKIAWYENTDGAGSFGLPRIITTGADGAQAVFAADLDRDGDADVLAASAFDDTVAWYENTDGQGLFSPPRIVTNAADRARDVSAADVDADGNLDILWAAEGSPYAEVNEVAWHENLDGQGTFGQKLVISSELGLPYSVCAADLDGDGDQDALIAFHYIDKISWYENDCSPPSARATFRNAGTNPASHDAATLPVIGTTYVATVNVGLTTHAFAILAGYAEPLTFTLPTGQTLLADAGGPELIGLPFELGPVATFQLPVPTDLIFVGVPVFTQAVQFGSTQPWALSNAQDLVVGF